MILHRLSGPQSPNSPNQQFGASLGLAPFDAACRWSLLCAGPGSPRSQLQAGKGAAIRHTYIKVLHPSIYKVGGFEE